MSFVMIIELLIVLAALYVGSRYGSLALGAIYGIAWLADTYFSNYIEEMEAMLSDLVARAPWTVLPGLGAH